MAKSWVEVGRKQMASLRYRFNQSKLPSLLLSRIIAMSLESVGTGFKNDAKLKEMLKAALDHTLILDS